MVPGIEFRNGEPWKDLVSQAGDDGRVQDLLEADLVSLWVKPVEERVRAPAFRIDERCKRDEDDGAGQSPNQSPRLVPSPHVIVLYDPIEELGRRLLRP